MKLPDNTPQVGLVLLALFVMMTLSNCGTILSGPRQEVAIRSTPPGAAVFINNQSFGDTPTVAKLKRSDEYTILIEMPGYEPYEVTIKKKGFNKTTFGNILGAAAALANPFAGAVPLLGFAIDAVSGSLYKLSSSEVKATFASELDETIPTDESSVTEEPSDEAVTPSEQSDGDVKPEEPNEDMLLIKVVLKPDPNWEKIGNMTRTITR
ncbi:MAG: PEGA domain-containing protein [candidate division Zixibacteria bacterium]